MLNCLVDLDALRTLARRARMRAVFENGRLVLAAVHMGWATDSMLAVAAGTVDLADGRMMPSMWRMIDVETVSVPAPPPESACDACGRGAGAPPARCGRCGRCGHARFCGRACWAAA